MQSSITTADASQPAHPIRPSRSSRWKANRTSSQKHSKGTSPPISPESHPLIQSQPRRRCLVCLLGSPKIRQYPCLCRLRRQGLHLARTRLNMDQSLRFCPSHRIRKHNLLVTPRIRLSPRLCLLRWQRLRARIQRQQHGPQDLPRAWYRSQLCKLGTEHEPWISSFERWRSGRSKEIRYGWK